MQTRNLYFQGSLENEKIHVTKQYTLEQDVIPGCDQTYSNTNNVKKLSASKKAHLSQMFKFIPEDRQDTAVLQ